MKATAKLTGKQKSKLIRKEKSVQRGYIKTEAFINRLFQVYCADGQSHNGKLQRYIQQLQLEAAEAKANSSEPEDAIILPSADVETVGAQA